MAETDAAVEGTKGVSQGLTKKLGPMPVWLWGLLIAGAGYYVYKRGLFGLGGGSSSSDQAATDQYGNPLNSVSGGSEVSNVGSPGYIPTDTSTTTTQPTSNDVWLTEWAVPQAIADGYGPTTALTALNTWLSGGTLTEDQQKLVDRVLADLNAKGIYVPQAPTGGSTSGAGTKVVGSPLVTVPPTNNGHSVTVHWIPIVGADTYQIQVRSESGYGHDDWSGWSTIASNIKGGSYNITTLQDKKGRVYQIAVRGVDSNGMPGKWSSGVTTQVS